MDPEVVVAAEEAADDFGGEVLGRDEPVLVAAQDAIHTRLELLLPDCYGFSEGRVAPLSDGQQPIPTHEQVGRAEFVVEGTALDSQQLLAESAQHGDHFLAVVGEKLAVERSGLDAELTGVEFVHCYLRKVILEGRRGTSSEAAAAKATLPPDTAHSQFLRLDFSLHHYLAGLLELLHPPHGLPLIHHHENHEYFVFVRAQPFGD